MKVEINGWITAGAAAVGALKVLVDMGLDIEERVHERRTERERDGPESEDQ